ncbi:MAG: rhodanese-like domain-containing protein [Spirochaetota bacterium]
MKMIRTIMIDLVAMALIAFGAGSVFNAFYPSGYKLRAPNDNIIAINTQLAKVKFDENAFFIDARSPAEYVSGHVPRAVNLPEDRYLEFAEALYDRIDAAPVVVVYCSDEKCDKSHKLAHNRLGVSFKGKRIYIMTAGMTGWNAKGYPSERKQ